MKVALLHDYLNQSGGAERVLASLLEIFPKADVYTLLYDKEKTLGRFGDRVKASFLDWPIVRSNHRWFIPLMPLAARTMNIRGDYDLIISDTAGFAKGFNVISHLTSHIPHLSYVHTPLRYAWEQEHYLQNVISNFQFSIIKPVLNYLKNWDYKMAQRPDILLANSQFIADKIKNCYNRTAEVIYPPVDTARFYREIPNPCLADRQAKSLPRRQAGKIQNYYLAVGRLLHYKRFDLVVKAFTELGWPLKVVGSGPEEKKLHATRYALRANNIEIIPFIEDENELRKLYNNAQALIFPQVEDFGLVAAEAQTCGTPVVAYNVGGAREIVTDGVTGVFFSEPTAESLMVAVKKCADIKFDRTLISGRAQRFSKDNFKKQILAQIEKLGIIP